MALQNRLQQEGVLPVALQNRLQQEGVLQVALQNRLQQEGVLQVALQNRLQQEGARQVPRLPALAAACHSNAIWVDKRTCNLVWRSATAHAASRLVQCASANPASAVLPTSTLRRLTGCMKVTVSHT